MIWGLEVRTTLLNMWVSLRTPSIISEVIEQLVLFTIYRRFRILKYDLDIESQRISMCSQSMFLVSLIFLLIMLISWVEAV